MEVSGRKEYSDKIDITDILCQPCQGDDECVSAEGYCETCKEFICNSCIKAHQKLAGTKNHVIKSGDEMPTVQSSSDPCTELCAVHQSEVLKFYCQQHDCVGCGDCMVLEHKSCKIQLVSDVSRNYGNSNELIRIKYNISHLNQNIAACKQEIERSLKEAEEMKPRIVAKIKAFRKDLNNYLDQVERDIMKEIEQLNARDVSHQRKLQDQCKSLESELKEFQCKLDENSEKINQLFVTSKLVQKSLQKYQEINQDIASQSQINELEFEPSKDLSTLQIKHHPIGNLSAKVKKFTGPSKKCMVDIKTHPVQKVNVQASEEGQCWITGMAMISSDEILLADACNRSLKIVNVSKGKITSTHTTHPQPFDVTVISSKAAAATLPEDRVILFLNIKNGLSEKHILKVKNKCVGIDHLNGKMAVSFCDSPAVQILDTKGNILHDVQNTSIFKWPRYISLSNDNQNMIVSDNYKHAIYELSVDGQLKSTIKSENLKYPAGLATTKNGTVFVCVPDNSDRVSMIIPGTKEILPLYMQSVKRPMSILVCEEQNKMYIGEQKDSKDSNYIKILEYKY